jgi:Flp pilus assembly protein TadG
MIKRLLSAFARRRDGSVSVIGAISLPILIAMVGLVAEYGNGLVHKMEDQRVADAAAFAAATAYNANSSNSLTSVVDAVASKNGLSSSNISQSLVTSPSGDGNQAILVSVSTTVPLLLSKVLGNSQANLTVTATSYAEMKGGAPGCIIALNAAGSGVTLSGGTAVTAAACAIASDNTVTVPCGTTITTIAVDYNSASAPSEPCSGIQPPSGKTLTIKKSAATDPLAGNSEVTTATARIATAAAVASPSAPTVSGGTACKFVYSAGCQSGSLPAGCADSWNSSTKVHTVTCAGNGPFVWGSISNQGGLSVAVNMTGANPEMDVNGSITAASGPAMTFSSTNPATYKITQGVAVSGAETLTFGAGTFYIGGNPANNSCNSSKNYSICDSSILTFGGPSTFVFQGGIYNSGGSTLTLGSGSTNSFDIGAANDGASFYAGGGAITTFADASSGCTTPTGASGCFQMAGNFDVASGGGSCTTLSASDQHDINGFFASAGGTTMGAGVYTIDKYFALGPNGGGDVTCSGTAIGLLGNNVTLVLGGASNPVSGTCSGKAFCMGAGFSNVTLLAPTSGSYANLAVVGPQSGTQGALLAEGASGADFSGAFYFPTAPVSLSGGSSLGSFGANQCLMVIGSQVSLTGGTALASSCSGLGGASNYSVVLVQ